MDKQTLSNYGWIVISVLVLVVMIALATPFARFVFNGTDGASNGLYDTENNALNAVGINIEAVEVRSESELFAALTKQQKIIRLGADIGLHDTIVASYDFTLDLNGHVLQQTVSNKGIIEVESGITLNIIDKYTEAYRHTFKEVDNHFVLDESGTIALYAGVISGANGDVTPILVRGTIIVDNLTIAGNYCSENGGVFAIMGGGKVILNSTTITNNTTDKNGGIVRLSANTILEMNGGFFTANKAKSGSAIYLNGGTFSMNGGRIEGNIADDNSGIYIESGVIMQNAGSIGDKIIDNRK